jgi:hypothetical protein
MQSLFAVVLLLAVLGGSNLVQVCGSHENMLGVDVLRMVILSPFELLVPLAARAAPSFGDRQLISICCADYPQTNFRRPVS